jgi:hypothetical protein
MPSLSKKQVFLAALTAGFLLVLIALFTAPAPIAHAFQVSILGQTNNPSGAPMAILGVTNLTGQARWFYFVAMVPTTNGWNGWSDASGWFQRQGPVWHRVAAHAECRVLLPTPEGAARWKFRCGSEREASQLEGLWYLFVRRAGLSRFRLRDRPPRSMVMTTEMGL